MRSMIGDRVICYQWSVDLLSMIVWSVISYRLIRSLGLWSIIHWSEVNDQLISDGDPLIWYKLSIDPRAVNALILDRWTLDMSSIIISSMIICSTILWSMIHDHLIYDQSYFDLWSIDLWSMWLFDLRSVINYPLICDQWSIDLGSMIPWCEFNDPLFNHPLIFDQCCIDLPWMIQCSIDLGPFSIDMVSVIHWSEVHFLFFWDQRFFNIESMIYRSKMKYPFICDQ